jgi:hypothetical protein
MKVEIITSRNFRKEAKRLLKKYPSLKDELREFNKKLLKNPSLGTSLGHVSIYDKSEFDSISDKDLRKLIEESK